ncbi:hypothetical protein WA026_009308 [Henosepilachna vigintioctopunctata]|uniref:Uncharacterized protein n=1 Tax=Henosepilachna vigintioctopunctata TaxID=420089 RepID=A0AAW1UW12_9CUCU
MLVSLFNSSRYNSVELYVPLMNDDIHFDRSIQKFQKAAYLKILNVEITVTFKNLKRLNGQLETIMSRVSMLPSVHVYKFYNPNKTNVFTTYFIQQLFKNKFYSP